MLTEREETAERRCLVSNRWKGRSTYYTFFLNRTTLDLTNPVPEWTGVLARLSELELVRDDERYHSPKCFPTRGHSQHPRLYVVPLDCVLTPSQRRAEATLERPRAIQPPMSQGNVAQAEL